MRRKDGVGPTPEVDPRAVTPSSLEDAGSSPESTSFPQRMSVGAAEDLAPNDTGHIIADPRAFRAAAAQITAILTRRCGPPHLERIDDAVQDAFAAAARRWPLTGVPRDAIAWLTRVAQRRYLDRTRADRRLAHAPEALSAAACPLPLERGETFDPAPLADDQLRLLFLCCHPALSASSRVALTLKCVAQFSVDEIARLLRADPQAVAQRLVRAKRTLRDTRATFVVPEPSDLPARLHDVHAVCYAIFAEGHQATGGELHVRPELCAEAIHLVHQLLRWSATDTPAGRALLAMMLLTAARLPARSSDGTPVPLAAQDRTQWDRQLIARGMRAFAASANGATLSRYHLEAQIAAAHATAATYADTPWQRIIAAYDQLREVAPSPMVELARAMAIAESGDVTAALAATHALPDSVHQWPEWHATCATLYARAHRTNEAISHWHQAIALTASRPVQDYYRAQMRIAAEQTRAD